MTEPVTSFRLQHLKKNSLLRRIVLHMLALFILVSTFILIRFPGGAKGYLYCVFREVVKLNIMVKTYNWNTLDSERVLVRYKPGEEENARLVLETTEAFIRPVARRYNFEIKDKIPIILYSSREELNASFGWPSSERAMGVYWGGVIRVLSPDEWIDYQDFQEKKAVFESCGPMAHELTHLVVDYKAKGNYPRWFTEGLAQYEEYYLTGFRFNNPAGDLSHGLYPLDKMDKNFDSLPNQALAYRQSLSAVEYIIKVYGKHKLHKIINNLSQGWTLDHAFKNSLGVSLSEFERNWHRWLAQKAASKKDL